MDLPWLSPQPADGLPTLGISLVAKTASWPFNNYGSLSARFGGLERDRSLIRSLLWFRSQ
jgi:hypothetical protein